MTGLVQLEESILLFIQEHLRSGFLTPFMQGITALGDSGMFWIALTILLLCFRKTRKYGFCSMVALLLSFLINNLAIKNLVNRTRPYEIIQNLKLITRIPHDASFPSGHSSASFASAVAIWRSSRSRKAVWLIVLAALIAFSRLYVGVHYPTDVLFGVISGILFGILGAYLGDKLWEKIQQWKASRKGKDIGKEQA